jgi:mRNA-degrading endonuclease toxin of MazEF toxin-antitoxin module
MASFFAGQLVVADWRDALPKEPNRLRPAVVVEDAGLFGPSYPNVILVPFTQDAALAAAGLSIVVEPTAENGLAKRSFALAHSVTATSKARVKGTQSRIAPEQLQAIRQKIAMAIGLWGG